MSKKKIYKNYVSPLDQFLKQFDHDHPQLSKHQKMEIAKHKRVYLLRDDPNATDIKTIWDEF